MIYLHKILPTFILPIMLFIIIIIVGLIKNKKKIIYWAIGIFYIISTPIFANNFFKIVEGNEYRKPISTINSADAIVVLSGMLEINEVRDSTFVEWGDPDRLFGGIALLKAGKAQKLVFTGGRKPWTKSRKTEGEVLKEFLNQFGIINKNIFVTSLVKTTEEESIAVKKLLGENKKIILVTSAFHMYRAKKLFDRVGFKVIPYKVDFKSKKSTSLTIMSFLPSSDNLNKTEIGTKELLARFIMLLKNIND